MKVNGWLTKYINMERGLRQGCALSMPLYILTAELLAIHIREIITVCRRHNTTPEKWPIRHWNFQYSSLVRARLRRQSKQRKNVKTSGVEPSSTVLMPSLIFNGSTPHKILGLFFGNIDCTRLNLEPRIKKICNTIAAWKHRDLSYKGKTLVINGLLTST